MGGLVEEWLRGDEEEMMSGRSENEQRMTSRMIDMRHEVVVIEYALYGAYYLQWSDTIRHTTISLYFILRGLLLPEYTILSNSNISYGYGHVTYQLYYYT